MSNLNMINNNIDKVNFLLDDYIIRLMKIKNNGSLEDMRCLERLILILEDFHKHNDSLRSNVLDYKDLLSLYKCIESESVSSNTKVNKDNKDKSLGKINSFDRSKLKKNTILLD